MYDFLNDGRLLWEGRENNLFHSLICEGKVHPLVSV